MASCANCGTAILFGGVYDDEQRRFCSENCAGIFEANDVPVPEDWLRETLQEVHQGVCPCCGGAGPVDVHYAYRVMSFLVITQYRTVPIISCSGCGTGSKIKNLFITMFLGWWGFPFGIILTPIYLFRNVAAMISPTPPHEPSPELREHVRRVVQHEYLRRMQYEQGESEQ